MTDRWKRRAGRLADLSIVASGIAGLAVFFAAAAGIFVGLAGAGLWFAFTGTMPVDAHTASRIAIGLVSALLCGFGLCAAAGYADKWMNGR